MTLVSKHVIQIFVSHETDELEGYKLLVLTSYFEDHDLPFGEIYKQHFGSKFKH